VRDLRRASGRRWWSIRAGTRTAAGARPSSGRTRVAQACPLCRAELPPGLDGLQDVAWRAHVRIEDMVDRGEASWMSMPAAAQEEVDEAVAMLAEAAAQGRTEVQEFRGTPMHSTLLLCQATLLPVHPSFTLS
jgi:hypothetical protein